MEPHVLTSLAGHSAFLDLTIVDGDAAGAVLARKAADLMVSDSNDDIIRFGRGWTDDMFMATSLLARVGAHTKDERYAQTVGRLLTTYAANLQRNDGVFIHAAEGPHAWGRGNGFAAFGLVEALSYLPDAWSHRVSVLEIYRRHVRGMLLYQTDDGAWRQVVDDPVAYKELTVTAMTVAAIARGIRHGWLDAAAVAAVDRGWRSIVARISPEGALQDVCPSTGAGATREHYLNRPAINGSDDRGAAMVLLASLEVYELRRTRRP